MKKTMQPKNSRQGAMEINRKLHKKQDWEGRYLWRAYVCGIGMAGLVEHEMTEEVEKLESFVQDSSDFLRKIKGMKLEADEFMFCSVPRDGGKKSDEE
jgi:hypothetical protein